MVYFPFFYQTFDVLTGFSSSSWHKDVLQNKVLKDVTNDILDNLGGVVIVCDCVCVCAPPFEALNEYPTFLIDTIPTNVPRKTHIRSFLSF